MTPEIATSTQPKPKKIAKKKVASKAVSTVVHKPVPPTTLDQQIILAAADPRVDVAKMKELTTLRRQLRMEEAEETFNIALQAAQQEMRPIEADANNPSTHSKYATLYAVDKALRPIYSKHGFSLSFNTADCPLPNHTRVLCLVSRGLYTRDYQYDVAIDAKGPKGNDVMNKTHAGGSALSYGKRYLMLMIFNVTIGDPGRRSDDDGNAAGGAPSITDAQTKELIKLLDEAGGDKVKFCAAFGVDGIALIAAKDFDEAKMRIARYKAAKTAKSQAAASDFPGDRK